MNLKISNSKRKRKDRKTRKSLPKTGCLIYGLVDPDTGGFRYVGQTRTCLETRLMNHVKNIEKQKRHGRKLSPCQKWIDGCLDAGKMPGILLIQNNGTWDASEAAWIERLSNQGHDLLNVLSRI